MTIPQWTLIAFALWTLLTMLFTVGITRWCLIISGKTEPRAFRADEPHGSPRYRRAMRAHANCVENLPIYAALIFGLTLLNIHSSLLNVLATTFIVARMCQTITHVAFNDTNHVVLMRFLFFFIQIVIMLWLAGMMIARLF